MKSIGLAFYKVLCYSLAVRGSSQISKFAGHPQRLIVLEGSPEVDLPGIASKLVEIAGRGLVIPSEPQTPENLSSTARRLFADYPEELVILPHFTVPARLAYQGLPDVEEIATLEADMGQLPTYAFFVKATLGYLTRRLEKLELATKADKVQQTYLDVYKDTKHPRKLYLSADGCTLERLAQTILFQADLVIREPYTDEDEDPRFDGFDDL